MTEVLPPAAPDEAERPQSPGAQDVGMKRVYGIAAVCCGVLLLLWWGLDIELPAQHEAVDPGSAVLVADEVPAPVPDVVAERIMNEGVNLLYQHGDPKGAADAFTSVLERNPEHYGALYQRAKALDMRRQLGSALDAWRRFERAALAASDSDHLQQARVRIGFLEQRIPELEQMVAQAVHFVHEQDEPEDALPLLVEVLKSWPTHYGARYQYAYALEEADEEEAAREAWTTFLLEAHALQATQDIEAANLALQRLADY